MLKNSANQPHQVFILHNPVAGTSDPDKVRAILKGKLDERNWEYRIYETTGQENVRDLVVDALQQGFNMVWAAGGDGTVSGVANALVNKNIPLGIIPIGTGNALARELGIPLDAAAACDVLLEGYQLRQLDVLQVADDYFILSVSIGISASTMAETARSQKRRFGRLAYFVNGFRNFLSGSLRRFRVLVDGTPVQLRAFELIAANSGIIGFKAFRWGSQVRPDDGEVNLCFLKINSVAGVFMLLYGILFNHQDQMGEIVCMPARETIEIQSRRRMPVQGDGEPIGYTPVKIKVVPAGLPVMTPIRQG